MDDLEELIQSAKEAEVRDVQERIDWYNKSERKEYRSQRAKQIIGGIKGFGKQVASLCAPSCDEINEQLELYITTNAINKNAYKSYLLRQEEYPIGKIKVETLPNGAERTTVFTPNGSVEKTEYPIRDREIKEGITSDITYEGLSVVDVNSHGKNQLVYSHINVRESSIYPKSQISGTMRDVEGNFTDFDYTFNYTEGPSFRTCYKAIDRLRSLQATFDEAYEIYSLNPENIIDLTKPAEEMAVQQNPEDIIELLKPTDGISGQPTPAEDVQ